MPPGADRIADTLVDAVFERNVDVQLEGVETALAHDRDHIVGVGNRFPLVGRRRDGGGQTVGVNVPLRQLHHHLQISGVDIHKGKVGVGQFGHGQNVVHQLAGEANRTGPDHRNFYRHSRILQVGKRKLPVEIWQPKTWGQRQPISIIRQPQERFTEQRRSGEERVKRSEKRVTDEKRVNLLTSRYSLLV